MTSPGGALDGVSVGFMRAGGALREIVSRWCFQKEVVQRGGLKDVERRGSRSLWCSPFLRERRRADR